MSLRFHLEDVLLLALLSSSKNISKIKEKRVGGGHFFL